MLTKSQVQAATDRPATCFGDVYRGRNVLVTGHNGFKGSWLSLWLTQLGARVLGYSLAPSRPSHFEVLKLDVDSVTGDVRDFDKLDEVVRSFQAEIVFHLAAQPLVRRSYLEPRETFATNVQGTINVYEACRLLPGLRAVVAVTSDKCYENVESERPYRETDPMGGSDPYSCSKGCMELVTTSYRRSFFKPSADGGPYPMLASARAGNVIGGGDWSEDRLVPDAVKATARREKVVLRNPRSIRPWQHVLEPLAGYLALGRQLLDQEAEFAESWNFGPENRAHVDVEAVVRKLQDAWPRVQYEVVGARSGPLEAAVLKLDLSKARSALAWQPVWSWEQAVEHTAAWYRLYYEHDIVSSAQQLHQYVADARRAGCAWSQMSSSRSAEERPSPLCHTGAVEMGALA
jgi:CDP-glucose 4,6-dehydratase